MKRVFLFALAIELILSAGILALPVTCADESPYGAEQSENPVKWGHSHLGAEYDEGPRSKPWKMDGIGSTHFPITSANPEVQEWFDQGNTLLHGFWPFEAERSFRWCLKLDPDCAMAYWGLARCVEHDEKRAAEFLKEAVARKENVSQRERDYIELWEAKALVAKTKKAEQSASGDDKNKAQEAAKKAAEDYAVRFDKLLMNYPDDIEARALYWLELRRTLKGDAVGGDNPFRFGMEAVLQEVLAKDPDHVGALHYRIHNWDSDEGVFAVDSCLRLSEAAPNCGHLQHMPGHVLSGVGLWHEAAIAMDSATRVEKEYMRRRMVLPDENWNYVHNLDYLCYIQEQLGMFDAAMTGARQLAAAPHSVKKGRAAMIGVVSKIPAVRAMIKAERWDEILAPRDPLLIWDDENPNEAFLGGYARVHALIGNGKLDEAENELQTLKEPPAKGSKSDKDDDAKKTPAGPPPELMKQFLSSETKLLELEGKLLIAQGKHLEGLEMLSAAAKRQAEKWSNDPPHDPMYLYNTLGDAYLELGSPKLAVAAYERTLQTVKNDGFALSGLVRAYAQLDETDKAKRALSKLKAVWSDADAPNRRLELALATGIDASPQLDGPIEERNYQLEVLAKKGPSLWNPAPAPDFAAVNSKGETVHLSDFAGKNVILIFYQGGECLHCMEQMQAANEKADAFEKLDTVLVAISKDDQEAIQGYEEDLSVTLLSDPDFEISKAYRSYDDFEEIELHSTVLIDKNGRHHWSQHGGDPFMDFDFFMTEIERMNGLRGEGTAEKTAEK